MEQRRVGSVNRRRFLETTAGAALIAWSLTDAPPGRAAPRSDRARAPEAGPKRGGALKWAGPAEVAHFDVHQGAFRFVLCQMYNNLVRFNPADGLKTIIPDLAESLVPLPGLPRLAHSQHIVAQPTEFEGGRKRKVLIGIQPGHGSGGLVLLNLAVYLVPMRTGVCPGVHEVFGS